MSSAKKSDQMDRKEFSQKQIKPRSQRWTPDCALCQFCGV
jgi:hypothetical protein